MKLFWKIFSVVFICLVVVVASISYVIIVIRVSDAENHLVEENRVVGSLISKEIEVGYLKSHWPLESLRKLSEREGFLFWWVLRDDGTIHLADSASFMGTYAYEYFPQISDMRDENVFLNRNQNYGILIKPLEAGEKKWSFWLGFSLRELLEIRKQIIFLVMVGSTSGLVMFGVILYFAIMQFTKPIRDFTLGAATIGKGDLTYRVKVESKDELAELASSFNKMAEDLQQTTVSKGYVSNIIDSMIDTLIVVDPDAKIRTINKAACKLLGYKEEELIGRPVEILFAAPEKIPLLGTKLEKLIEEGELSNYETYYKTKDGKKIPILLSCSVMKNENGNIICVVCTARDITERKRAEEALSEANARLKGLQQVTADVHSTLNLEKVFRQVSDGVVNFMGYTTAFMATLNNEKKFFKIRAVCTKKRLLPQIDKILGFSLRGFSFPADPQLNPVVTSLMKGRVVVARNLAEVAYPLVSKKACSALQRLRGTKNYILVPLKAENRVVGGVCITSSREEISEEELRIVELFALAVSNAINNANLHMQTKRAEEALVQERDLLQSLIDNIPDSIYFKDEKNRFIRVNRTKAEHSGATPENMIGKTDFDFFPKEQAKEAFADDDRVMQSNRPLVGKVEKVTHTDGTDHWVSVTKIPRHDEKGQVIGTMGISRDITERKKAEETLIRSERLRALGEMAGGVAHDFNNLLAIILGNAQLLERGLKRYKAEEIKERLKVIARTADEGRETVRRLQHFTRREVSPQELTRLTLNEIVRSAISSTSPRWKDEAEAKGVFFRIKENLGKLPPVLGSRSGMMEVLTNLIFNSLEAMPEGGEIRVRTKVKGNNILLYFTDSGKGIPKRIKDRIFDPFFSTKGPKASGLGLSMCYGIVKRHKGDIKVDSIKGKGTTFTISIPVSREVALKEEKPRHLEKISPKKVLVIDDEEGVRDVLGTILHDEGHRVALAETARKGLDRFKQDDFDLVLTDLGMPEMSGWQLAKKIKEIDPSVPVGLISGWAVATPKEKMKKEGVDFILSKPFDLTKVVSEVNAALKSKKR